MSAPSPAQADPLLASIIIPHYNDLDNLRACLDCLEAQTIPRDRFEIVVADNNSRVGLDAVRSAVGDRARVVPAPEQGAGPARNAGVTAAIANILVFTDSDCRPHPDFLRAGLEALEAFDFVGGRMEVFAQDPDHVTPDEAFELVFAFQNDVNVTKRGFSVTANMVVRRPVFDAVGGFRNGVSEDKDWCHRARDMGFRIGYAPGSLVRHPARRTWSESIKKARRLTDELYMLLRPKRLGAQLWFLRTFAVLLSIAPHSVVVFTSPKLTSWGSRWGAFTTLVKLRVLRFVWGNALLLKSA